MTNLENIEPAKIKKFIDDKTKEYEDTITSLSLMIEKARNQCYALEKEIRQIELSISEDRTAVKKLQRLVMDSCKTTYGRLVDTMKDFEIEEQNYLSKLAEEESKNERIKNNLRLFVTNLSAEITSDMDIGINKKIGS